jgi:hypothetical protein
MVVTMLEAAVDEDHTGLLIEKFTAGGDSLPPSILESFLLHDAGTGAWRIVTIWTSREALDGYRTAVETPEGVRMFRAAGAEPALSVWEVAAHADHV